MQNDRSYIKWKTFYQARKFLRKTVKHKKTPFKKKEDLLSFFTKSNVEIFNFENEENYIQTKT